MRLLLVALMAVSGFAGEPLLKGLKKLALAVPSLPAEWERSGFSANRIRTDVEIRLRRVGIEITADLSDPLLVVSLSQFADGGSIIYAIEVRLTEDVVVLHRGASVVAQTWVKTSFGIVGSRRVDSLRVDITDKVDDFINDWLKANPPARSGSFEEFMRRDREAPARSRFNPSSDPLGSQVVIQKMLKGTP